MSVKTLFMGSGIFANEILDGLVNLGNLDIVGIVTQPDKPTGRKQIPTPTELKMHVVKKYPYLIDKISQPEKIRREYQEILNSTKPDIIVVASYGQIVPKEVLEYPKYKCLNVHGSILPELRGAVPVQMSILLGHKESGVTLQIMAEGMDEGDIIATKISTIEDDDTSESLMNKLSIIGRELVEITIPDWIDGKIKAQPQDSSKATYCYQLDISKQKAELDFDVHGVVDADRMIRAFYPWPIVWFKLSAKNRVHDNFAGKIFKIFRAKIHDRSTFEAIGKIFRKDKSLLLQLKDGTLELLEVQLEGKNRMEAPNYLFLVS